MTDTADDLLGTGCVGVAMVRGQADIDASAPGTTFCLSGTHNWTLSPKSGDQLIGPAVLDGARSTRYAIEAGSATNVVLSGLEIRNYTVANKQGAIHNPDAQGSYQPSSAASGWILRNLQVHDNGTSAGGAGANLGDNWRVLGGRYYNNRQEGLGDAGDGVTVAWVELDHNNFTDDTYTKSNISCEYEAGGFKWVSDNVTVENSKIHDNACKGLWTDINSQGAVITNNLVYNNWNAGIFIEISSGAIVTWNTVYGNGSHSCSWLWDGGITLASSDHAEIAHNTVTENCDGITGTQQNRPDGHPGLLENLSIHDNAVAGPGGKAGVAADNSADLTKRNIVFSNNTFSNGMSFCNLNC